jgi:hypothetical protein
VTRREDRRNLADYDRLIRKLLMRDLVLWQEFLLLKDLVLQRENLLRNLVLGRKRLLLRDLVLWLDSL